MKTLFAPSKHSLYLSVFRIYLSIHVLYKFFTMLMFNNLLYGSDSFAPILVDRTLSSILPVNVILENSSLFLMSGIALSLCMMVGVGKNITILLIFVLMDIFQRLNSLVLNGGDNLLKFLLFYLVFADSFRHYTLFKYKKKDTSTKNLLTNLAIFSIKFHLMLIYFLSGIHKANSKVWFSGVATYYTFALERFQGTSFNKHIVQSGFFVTISTYITLFWELFFPFLISNKKTKLITIIIGVFLHLGIFVFMMIYDFEILFIACYGFFFTDAEILRFVDKVTKKLNTISIKLFRKGYQVYEQ